VVAPRPEPPRPRPIAAPEPASDNRVVLIAVGGGLVVIAIIVAILLARRRTPAQLAKDSGLLEFRVVVESDQRKGIAVWLETDRTRRFTNELGEVTLQLPHGDHVVHIDTEVGILTREITVGASRPHRLVVNVARERIAASGSRSAPMDAVQPPIEAPPRATTSPQPSPSRTTTSQPRATSPQPAKIAPQTSVGRSYPSSASQGDLGDQLQSLIDVELDAPTPAPVAKPVAVGSDPALSRPKTGPAFKAPKPPSAPVAVPTNAFADLELDESVPEFKPPKKPGA